MRMYTIGHSNLSTEELIERLRSYKIGVLVDVRSKPFSRYNPHFNRYVIAEDLRKAGIPYVWLGHSIGGMPDDPDLLTRGKVDFDKVRASEAYQDGIEQLKKLMRLSSQFGEAVILCGEQDPTGCHRRRLIGADLVKQEIELLHIVKDGELVPEHEVRERLGENQPSVFDLLG